MKTAKQALDQSFFCENNFKKQRIIKPQPASIHMIFVTLRNALFKLRSVQRPLQSRRTLDIYHIDIEIHIHLNYSQFTEL